MHIQKRPEPNHLPLVGFHLKLADIGYAITEFLIGLDDDLPGPAKTIEIVDIVRAQVNLKRVEHLADRNSQGHALGPVDVEVEPGCAGPRATEKAHQAWRPIAPADKLLGGPLQFILAETAPVLDDELEAGGRPQSLNWRSPERRYQPAPDLFLATLLQSSGNGVRTQPTAFPCAKLLENDVHRSEIGCVGVQDQRPARHTERVFDPRRIQGHPLNAVENALRPVHRGGIRKLHV